MEKETGFFKRKDVKFGLAAGFAALLVWAPEAAVAAVLGYAGYRAVKRKKK